MNSLNSLKASWVSRKNEIEQYNIEKRLHEAVIAGLPVGLPDDWPVELVGLRGSKREAFVAANLSDADFELVLNLNQRDKAWGAIREILFELQNCQALLAAQETELAFEDRSSPPDKATAGFIHLESLRVSGEIVSYTVDEETIKDFGSVGMAAVTITLPDLSTKRRVMLVNDDGEVLKVHSSKSGV